MRRFDEITDIAAARKGGRDALEALVERPLPPGEVAAIPPARWLAAMARSLFEAGFNWQVVATKWPGIEAAFDGFDPARVAHYRDDDIDRLLADRRMVRNGARIAAVIHNAGLLDEIAAAHGSAGRFFADWPDSDFAGLVEFLAKRGARLGGITGQRMLRRLGRSGYILSPDVVARLIAEGVLDAPPTGKRAMQAVQAAFNTWAEESGRSLTEISRILALSV